MNVSHDSENPEGGYALISAFPLLMTIESQEEKRWLEQKFESTFNNYVRMNSFSKNTAASLRNGTVSIHSSWTIAITGGQRLMSMKNIYDFLIEFMESVTPGILLPASPDIQITRKNIEVKKEQTKFDLGKLFGIKHKTSSYEDDYAEKLKRESDYNDAWKHAFISLADAWQKSEDFAQKLQTAMHKDTKSDVEDKRIKKWASLTIPAGYGAKLILGETPCVVWFKKGDVSMNFTPDALASSGPDLSRYSFKITRDGLTIQPASADAIILARSVDLGRCKATEKPARRNPEDL
ncbi:MAG: hypothetical protein JWM56_1299 [Candidatus Peribacteria bacterium]|nr:hypothetical protein [Candidatus Peribacteria bacterium]